MEKDELKLIWEKANTELFDCKLSDNILNVLASQTLDSIRRVEIYRIYKYKAEKADLSDQSYFSTSTPFILGQRKSLSLNSRTWIVYLATYFGKSNKSRWSLFKKAAFKGERLIQFEDIKEDKSSYFDILERADFFKDTSYSNHRKYTKKSLIGNKGVFHSMDHVIDNINLFSSEQQKEFDTIYKGALKIPNFGRMAAFDFTSSLSKCELNVSEPLSMYHKDSTGPMNALEEILNLTRKSDRSKNARIRLGNDLLNWFRSNSDIYFIAQVLEDAICNWQKSPHYYIRYFG